jgi:hypothetical protein
MNKIGETKHRKVFPETDKLSPSAKNLREAIELSNRASERSLRVARKSKERPHYPAMGHNCSCLDCPFGKERRVKL